MGGAKNRKTRLRVANIGKEYVSLEKGQHTATVDESGWVTKPKVDKGFKKNWKHNGEMVIYFHGFRLEQKDPIEDWVDDDNKITEKLKERWLNRNCIELDIIDFEEARQGEYETLAQFMQRLKGLDQRAFGEFDANGMHQRII